ncbi:tyrosine-type recombinase/integrase [Hymenobacter aerilatus]|uniref:Tyrosine-type recombinase/integrase n=1 Tax=Hymenobacter aerilatus TaxID=2932251 RepID=A0A8T9T0H9_9BACT|nr:tyrosine-type recombinase/integrase [Hymenobacter aerilatus]UOR07141.1 tyrosine-type recombinase/integrase [Hymenobacter aerilatus]
MKLKLWLKLHKINKAGKAPVSLRITLYGKRAEYSSEIRLFPDEWDQATETILPTRRKQATVDKDNDLLEELKADARQAKNSLPKSQRTALNVAKEMRGIMPDEDATTCLLAALDRILATHYQHANQSTLQPFTRAAALLRKWHGPGHLPAASFTEDRRDAFGLWLAGQMASSSARTYLSALTAMWNRVKAWPHTRRSFRPFFGLRLPRHSGRKRTVLTKEQLLVMQEAALPPKQALARDIYMACFYLHGSRVSAVMQLRWQNVDFTKGEVKYKAMKSGPEKTIALKGPLLPLLLRYHHSSAAGNDLIFPILPPDFFSLTLNQRHVQNRAANVRILRRLYTLCKNLGLPEHVHPHTARHTMAVLTVEANNGDIRAAQHVLGHSTYRQTETYLRKMLPEQINDAAANVYDSF